MSEDYNSTIAITRPLSGLPFSADDLSFYLVVVEGSRQGRRIEITAETLTVGRDGARDLVLEDSEVSRLHFQVRLEGTAVLVEDMKSTNGTFLNGAKLAGAAPLAVGGYVQAGHHLFTLERRSRREIAERDALDRDLDKAGRYVRSLLPPPIPDGPIRTDWVYHPSAQLGGDALGYDRIDDDHFACYLIDVSGHGAGAAMHSVAVMNVLRQRALPGIDFRKPNVVLGVLNRMFQMDRHDGMFFTIWFGVYHASTRRLQYACGGHHPAYLVDPGGHEAVPLGVRGLMIGGVPDVQYKVGEVVVPHESRLYLFSDGLFDTVDPTGRHWRIGDVIPRLANGLRPPSANELFDSVVSATRPGPWDDDVTALIVTFP